MTPKPLDLNDWVPVRALTAEDRDAIAAHLLALDDQDRYLRFGHAVGPELIASYVAGLDFERDEVLGIFSRKLELLGMAHLATLGPGEAEFGVSVLKKARGRCYGQRLFEHACLHARRKGVKALIIYTLSDNAPMLAIARKAGAAVVRDSGEAVAHLALPPAERMDRWLSAIDDQAAEWDFHWKAWMLRVASAHDGSPPTPP
jgi:GNAT superfamily N-acetyltransferase